MDVLGDPYCTSGLSNGTIVLGICERSEESMSFLIVGVPIPTFAIFVNTSVLLAAALQRKTLRRYNYVFSSVCSTLVGNLLFAFLNVWTSVENYILMVDDNLNEFNKDNIAPRKWWIARNATTICLLLAMCGNIGSLVYVLMDSTYFVGRTVCKSASLSNQENAGGTYRMTKRRKAKFLIALSWTIPAVLAFIATATSWNCIKCCCPPGRYARDSCSVAAGCSRFWPPVTQSFLGVFLGVWIVEVFLLSWLLAHTALKFRKVLADRGVSNNVVADSATVTSIRMDESSVCPETISTNGPHATTTEMSMNGVDQSYENGKSNENGTSSADSQQRRHDLSSTGSDTLARVIAKKRATSLKFIQKCDTKLRTMISLTILFLVFTFVVVLAVVVDISTDSPMPGKDAFIIVSQISSCMYTLICPFLLLKFMPRLKFSVVMCFYKCCHSCDV